MDRMFVIKAVEYRPEEDDAAPTRVEDLGFSLVRLMRLSDGEATGVRANLEINDRSALTELARYYAQNTQLEWTFEMGGGGTTFTVALRWTKFDLLNGTIQAVRTAVLRDLIREAEGAQQSQDSPSTAPVPADETDGRASPNRSEAEQREPEPVAAPQTSSDPSPVDSSLLQRMSRLWPRLFGGGSQSTRDASEERPSSTDATPA